MYVFFRIGAEIFGSSPKKKENYRQKARFVL